MVLLKRTVLLLAVLALVFAGCDRKISGDVELADNSSASCFDCHSDVDVILREARIQYENSVHAAGENTNRNHLYSSGYASCERCHTAEGFIAYINGTSAGDVHFTAIECFTCHQPHSTGELTVRVTTAVELANGALFDRGPANLCASCHQSRRDVNTTVVDGTTLSSHFGPHHSNQGDMIIGENAYEYSGYNYQKSAHALAPKACVHCHMSLSQHETVGGHAWNMRNEERGFENITGCNNDEYACHGGNVTMLDNLAEADFDGDGTTEGIQSEVNGLLDSLETLLIDANLLTPDEHPVARTVTTADSVGALYNWLFVEEDRSHGVHNTDYAVGLLVSSINFLNTGSPTGTMAAARPSVSVEPPDKPVLLGTH